MVGLAGRVCECCLDIVRLKVGEVFQDFFVRHAFGQHAENIRDANAHPANARPPTALARFDCDAFEKLHSHRIRQRVIRDKPAEQRVDQPRSTAVASDSAAGNPNGIVSSSPRLRGTSYLGSPNRKWTQPQRGCRHSVFVRRAGENAHNPVGVVIFFGRFLGGHESAHLAVRDQTRLTPCSFELTFRTSGIQQTTNGLCNILALVSMRPIKCGAADSILGVWICPRAQESLHG